MVGDEAVIFCGDTNFSTSDKIKDEVSAIGSLYIRIYIDRYIYVYICLYVLTCM
jgi:hypothetical protein